MLSVTEEGENTAAQLWDKPRKDAKEMAFIAAVDLVANYVMQDSYSLANMIPFIHGDTRQKVEIIDEWIEQGLLEK